MPKTGQNIGASQVVNVTLRGLDLSSPYDMVAKNRSPYAQNFRLYAEASDDRRSAISTRKGSGLALAPIGETLNDANTGTTGASNANVGVTSPWVAFKITPSSGGRLSRLDVNIRNLTGTAGAVVVEVRTNASNIPGVRIADSGIQSSKITSSYAYVPVRFIEAPLLVASTSYWIVVKMQQDGVGNYQLSTNTGGTSLNSTTTGNSWNSAAYAINYKTYLTPDKQPKGLFRYTPDNNQNRTLMALDTTMYRGDDALGTFSSIATGLSASATDYFFSQADNKVFWVDGFDDLKYWDGTTVTTITNANLPILKLGIFHKNRFFGVSATDPNRLVFSEAPGNADGTGALWYKAYLSTNFIYIPSPHANDPITAIVSFQDNLHIFTSSNKYVLYGDNPGNFILRQATGSKGAMSQKGVFADESYIYFVSNDGLYRYNGTNDELLSDTIQPAFDDIADRKKVCIAKHNRVVRFYYPSSGSAYNDTCLLYHTTYKEWLKDTDTYVAYAVGLTDANDPNYLIEASSLIGTVYNAEQDYSNLGKAIDFKYWLNYESFGNPAAKKRFVRLKPLLQGRSGKYTVYVRVDGDMSDNPTSYPIVLETSAPKWGTFVWGDGTKYGADISFAPQNVRVTGYAYYWQMRIEAKGINNPVEFMGYVLSFRAKKM